MASIQLKNDLYTYFQKQSFLPGQQDIIEDVLAGIDVLGILPTGSGKSIMLSITSHRIAGYNNSRISFNFTDDRSG